MKKKKVLLIGWDAADWKVIWPLIAKGKMPALKKLMENGVYGNMATMNPPYSPMLWSSVATGKTPDKHGVLGFVEVLPNLKGIRPVTVTSRKSKAIWNILHNKGYKSNVVGWWPSFPAEPINGVVVSDKFQKVKLDPKAKNPIINGTIHPNQAIENLADLRMFPHEITEAHILPFMPKASEIDQDKDKGLEMFAKIMAENVSVHAVATNLMRTTEWDFMAIYYDLIDHFCHAYMKFHPPKHRSVPLKLYNIYKDNVKGAYRFQDMMLERTLELIDDDTTVIVMSDHGFESGHRRILKMPDYPAAPALEHRQFGIFVASGPNIKKNEKVFGLGLVDIAPTLLHMFGLPIGKDMDGNVALDIFENMSKPSYIDSWEDIEGDFGQHEKANEIEQFSDNETMQQLIDLGYIDRPDVKIENAIIKTRSDLKHNLARVYIGKKDYMKAKELLLELVRDTYPVFEEKDIKKTNGNQNPYDIKAGDSIVDLIPYYMDLLSVSLSEKDYEKAEEYLNELRTRDKRFELKTHFSEAKILVGKGKIQQALNVLNEAKKNKPNSEVWYQIGKIYMQLSKFEEAKLAFEKTLEFESDKAKFHHALAVVYIRLENFEEAVEHALTSIELVKYFPEAHYTLGEALEKMGDLENAKKAYDTADKLKPKPHHRLKHALDNMQEKIETPTLKEKSHNKYKKDQIVVVSGLPRSGTSLMMQMLDKGGADILTDNNRKPDESNPKGYYEYNPVMSIHKNNDWLEFAQNKSVKIVAPLLKFLDPKYRYKIIFMNRDLNEVVKSQQKMIGKDPETLPMHLFENYKKLLKLVEFWKDKEPGVELVYINYKDALNNTEEVIEKVSTFIGIELNKEEMAACVDNTLYRNRV